MTKSSQSRQLHCAFDSVHVEFAKHIETAKQRLSPALLDEYFDGIEFFAKIGQGPSISITFANMMYWVGEHFGEGSIKRIADFSYQTICRSPNKDFMVDFLISLMEVINHTKSDELDEFLTFIDYHLAKTTYSVHGIHVTHSSPSFRALLSKIGMILSRLDYEGAYAWIDYGLRYFKRHPDQQEAFFSLSTSDSRAVFQRQFPHVANPTAAIRFVLVDCGVLQVGDADAVVLDSTPAVLRRVAAYRALFGREHSNV